MMPTGSCARLAADSLEISGLTLERSRQRFFLTGHSYDPYWVGRLKLQAPESKCPSIRSA